MSLFKRWLAWVMHHKVSKLDELYQRHAGEECYIFGNGISLKWMDLHQFADRPAILAHHMIYHREAEALNAPYCTIFEPGFFYPFYRTRERGNLVLRRHHLNVEYRKSILEHPETLFFINISDYPVARFSNALYVSRAYIPPFAHKNPFKERPDAYEGTLKFQISLAIFLGFKKAYLVGHDYTHYPSRWLHFFEKGMGHVDEKRHFADDFLNYAKERIDLVTVTLESASETLDFVTYKDLTGKEPHFRDNIEIVNRAKLDGLATWKDYSIYR